MNAFIALVRKDLVLYFSNRRSVIMAIVAPILIAAFFGSLFGSKDNKPANIPIAVTDLDRSAAVSRPTAMSTPIDLGLGGGAHQGPARVGAEARRQHDRRALLARLHLRGAVGRAEFGDRERRVGPQRGDDGGRDLTSGCAPAS